MMKFNILNGDSLAYSFPDSKIDGEVIVMREALMDGNLSGDNLHDFWQSRASYIGVTETDYYDKVVSQFEKVINAPGDSEFNLWFEYDLFCQVNMWFIISLINSLPISKIVYAVYTSHLDKNNKQFWNGFGQANSDELAFCYSNRILLTDADLQLGTNLWKTYKSGNIDELNRFSETHFNAFPYLDAVIEAHADRFPKDGSKGRPERVIEEIIQNGAADFNEVFKEFWNRESIYGFGDIQLKHLYDKVIKS